MTSGSNWTPFGVYWIVRSEWLSLELIGGRAHGVRHEAAVYSLTAERDFWKLWWLPPAIRGSSIKFIFCSCSLNKDLSDLERFLTALNDAHMSQVQLLQSHRAA